MVGRASIIAASVSLLLSGTVASQNTTAGTAGQHAEWSRKFVNGSTTRATTIDDWDPVGTAQPGTCGQAQSVLEATSARQWQLDSCD